MISIASYLFLLGMEKHSKKIIYDSFQIVFFMLSTYHNQWIEDIARYLASYRFCETMYLSLINEIAKGY